MQRTAILGLILGGLTAFPACGPRVYAVRTPPPPPPPYYRAYMGRAPGPGYVWTDGFWAWRGGGYVWAPGRWVRPPHPRARWVPGYWAHRHRGYVWVQGRWR